jgi:hypothetical protein
MRKILIAGLAILMFACNQKTEKKLLQIPDVEQENLKGKVKQVETDTYTVDSTGKMGAMDTCCNYVEVFDDNGFTSKYITKDEKGNIKSEQSFLHNDDGLFMGMSTVTNNKKISSLSIELDKDGKYGVAKSFDSTGKMDSYFDGITTNEFGQITGATEHHTDSTLKMSFTSRYENHFFVGNESKDSTGKVTYSSTVKLNDKNDQEQLTENTVNKDSTKTTVTTYKYDGRDEQGNWTQQTTYDDKGKATKIIKRVITYAEKKG